MITRYKVAIIFKDLFDGYVFPFLDKNETLIKSARATIFKHNETT